MQIKEYRGGERGKTFRGSTIKEVEVEETEYDNLD
jgi:hypothetical protein